MTAIWIAALWGGLTILAGWQSRRNLLALPSLERRRSGSRSDVTVVIPARNEAGKIGRAVGSLENQARVLVVDDASTDGTFTEAVVMGADVMTAPRLPNGALGKPNACLAGARSAETPWILFVDADTWYEPDFVASLVDHAERKNLDMVSVFPRQICQTWVEKLLLPYAFGLYFCGVNPARDPIANGQCLLFRAGAYWSFGGHQAVIGSVIEDMALAQLACRQGLRQQVLRADELASVRMYDSLRAIWEGFQKNSFRFLAAQPRTAVRVIAASVLFTSFLPVLLALLAEREWACALLASLVPMAAMWSWYGSARERLLAPAAIYLFQLIALDGMRTALGRGKAVWKGRYV